MARLVVGAELSFSTQNGLSLSVDQCLCHEVIVAPSVLGREKENKISTAPSRLIRSCRGSRVVHSLFCTMYLFLRLSFHAGQVEKKSRVPFVCKKSKS